MGQFWNRSGEIPELQTNRLPGIKAIYCPHLLLLHPDDVINVVWKETTWIEDCRRHSGSGPIVLALILSSLYIFSLALIIFARVKQSPWKLLHSMTALSVNLLQLGPCRVWIENPSLNPVSEATIKRASPATANQVRPLKVKGGKAQLQRAGGLVDWRCFCRRGPEPGGTTSPGCLPTVPPEVAQLEVRPLPTSPRSQLASENLNKLRWWNSQIPT